MRPGSTRGIAVAALLLIGSLAPASTLAGGESLDAQFSTDGGNEWWIEVYVDANEPLDAVAVSIDGASWRPLEHKDWGAWAASYHAPEGSTVEFRATSTDRGTVYSQVFQWPSGDPGGDGSFEVDFTTNGGNEWWIEVYVDANEPLDAVAVSIDGGGWRALEHKDWGAYAASYHAPEGSIVEFRAVPPLSDSVESQPYHWPSGEPVDGTDGDPVDGTSDGFTADFSTPGGNEWWIEVYVDASEPLAGVDARIDGGDWRPLEHKHWGAWAASYHAPEGSTLEFRAASSDGERATSDTYRWTSGERVSSGTQDATMDAAFGPKAGNAWWVETYVAASSSITQVEARADGGAWHALELRDWGAWTASFHVPDGSVVAFRATNETGAVATSGGFLWPDAAPADDPHADWPHRGSYADYDLYGGGPTAEYKYEQEAVYVHDGDGWVVRCQGYREDPGGREQVFDYAELPPPEGPSHVRVGQQVSVEKGGCHRSTYDDLTVLEQRAYDARRDGEQVTVTTWFANRTADCNCLGWEAYWETETDMVTEWWRGGRTGNVGELQDTDAPMSEG